MSDEENPELESLLKKELDEFMSKQVENRKRFMQTSIVDSPEVETFDGVGTESINHEISSQPGSFKADPFKSQSTNTNPNQTENKSKQAEIRVLKLIVDCPQVESFDSAGTKSQNDEISILPWSSKAVPFKNQSINTDPNQSSRGETINEEEKSKFKFTGLFKKELDEHKSKQVEIRKRLDKELKAKLITLKKNKENLSPTSPLIEDSFRRGCKISVLLFYVFFFRLKSLAKNSFRKQNLFSK